MTSNTHPDMHGSEPDEHYHWCPTLCELPLLWSVFDDEDPTCEWGHTDHSCTCDEPPDEDYSDDD
jgi:hypothetical protein